MLASYAIGDRSASSLLLAAWVGGADRLAHASSRTRCADPDVLAGRMGCQRLQRLRGRPASEPIANDEPARPRRRLDERSRHAPARTTTPRRATRPRSSPASGSRPKASDEEVRELVLDVDRADFPYELGQSIGVLAPGRPEFGQRAPLPPLQRGRPARSAATRAARGSRSACGAAATSTSTAARSTTGVASNYLCDLRPGDTLTHDRARSGWPSRCPRSMDANLILIGTRHRHRAVPRLRQAPLPRTSPDWKGRVWLFYGAQQRSRAALHERRAATTSRSTTTRRPSRRSRR